jgi:hypothetical protein
MLTDVERRKRTRLSRSMSCGCTAAAAAVVLAGPAALSGGATSAQPSPPQPRSGSTHAARCLRASLARHPGACARCMRSSGVHGAVARAQFSATAARSAAALPRAHCCSRACAARVRLALLLREGPPWRAWRGGAGLRAVGTAPALTSANAHCPAGRIKRCSPRCVVLPAPLRHAGRCRCVRPAAKLRSAAMCLTRASLRSPAASRSRAAA